MLTTQQITDLRSLGTSWPEIALQDGTSTDAVRSRFRRRTARSAAKLDDSHPAGPSAEVTEIDRLRRQLGECRSVIDQLKREKIDSEGVMRQVYEHAAYVPKKPAWLTPDSDDEDRPRVRSTPVCMWADWHYGEVVDPAEVDGLNEFNSEICYQRVRNLVDGTIEIAMKHMGGPDSGEYPGAVVCLGGDFICGDIHEELAVTSEKTPQSCINELTDILYESLNDMLDAFGRLYVPCVVGNHGRGTLNPRCKNRVHTSHEWNIYCNLQRLFKDNGNIKFHIPTQTDARFTVNGHRFLLTHGDAIGVKGGDGIIGSIGPIMRGSVKVRGQEANIGRPVDTVLMGHWHQRLSIKGVTVTGTLKGYDEYARVQLRAGFERPSQEVLFVHPQWGIVPSWPIYVDGSGSKAAAETFVKEMAS